MIIFGTRGVTSTRESGQFHCPQCGPQQSFKVKRVRRFFTLYFIPIIPLDTLGEYLECGTCQGTYQTEVANYNPADEENQIHAVYIMGVKQAMIATLLADGVIDDDEVKELQDIFEEMTGIEVTEEDLREEIALIENSHQSAIELMSGLAGSINDIGKEKVIHAVLRIAAADGVMHDSELAFMRDIAQALQISDAHLRGILAEAMPPNQTLPSVN